MSCDVAILGATGAVGAEMMKILRQRDFPLGRLHLLASERSAGREVEFDGRRIEVEDAADFDFSKTPLALFSAGAAVSERHAERAAAAGCLVIDNTSRFRMEADVPLVVPEVNPEALAEPPPRSIVANPNCSTIQMVAALNPLHRAAGLARVNVCTYQSVSGAGRRAMEELRSQSAAALDGATAAEAEALPGRIAFNVLPMIDRLEDNGYTGEELKMMRETCKIFDDADIAVNATCARVPVFVGHAEAVHLETRDKLSLSEARALLADAAGVTLLDDGAAFPSPAEHGDGSDAVYVGRLREDLSHPRGLCLWIVADNLRKGAALNSVQIAEALLPRL